jgi:integrase
MTVRVKPCSWNPDRWQVIIRIRYPSGERKVDRKISPVASKSGSLRWGQDREAFLLQRGPKGKEKEEPQPPVAAKKEVLTLAKFAPDWLEKGPKANRRKHSTIESYRSILDNHLIPELGDKALDEIGDLEIASLKERLKEKAPKTVNNILSVLSKLLKSARAWKKISTIPEIEPLKIDEEEMEFYEDADLNKLVTAAELLAVEGSKKAGADRRPLLVVLLGADAGLRCGEMIALRWDDVDFARNRLRIQEGTWRRVTSSTKGRRVRHVEMTSRLRAALLAHRHLGMLVLLNNSGVRATQQTLGRWMERAERKAGMAITGRLHILRHTFCSRLAAAGATVLEIKELAGHKRIETTMKYMHLSPNAKGRAIGLLDQAAGGESKNRANAEVIELRR